MLFERQKNLLALLDALGGEVGGLDFQKLAFWNKVCDALTQQMTAAA